MSSSEGLREFVNQRLTAAAEEIFGVFKKTIVEYEKEIDRQRRLLDVVWKPEIKLHKIELPQQHVCQEEELLSDQQLWNQERNSSMDQEEPEPPQIKEEQEELCTSQEGEQLVLKQETETFMLTPTYEEDEHSEDQTESLDPDETVSAAQTDSVVNMPVIISVVSEANRDLQLLSNNSHEAESRDQKGDKQEVSGSTREEEPEQDGHQDEGTSPTNNDQKSSRSGTDCKTHRGKKPFKCDTCGREFQFKSRLQRHMRIHTGEKPYLCKMCGKRYTQKYKLQCHIKIHDCEHEDLESTRDEEDKGTSNNDQKTSRSGTEYIAHRGERPFKCNTCGKEYYAQSRFQSHMRMHTGEKPYVCKTCGIDFKYNSNFIVHMRVHTGEKPYMCKECGKKFRKIHHLNDHMRTHTGERPYKCKECGKGFTQKGGLSVHSKIHIKPFICSCGKAFRTSRKLAIHKGTAYPH